VRCPLQCHEGQRALGRGLLPAVLKEACHCNRPLHSSYANTQKLHLIYHAPHALASIAPPTLHALGKQPGISFLIWGYRVSLTKSFNSLQVRCHNLACDHNLASDPRIPHLRSGSTSCSCPLSIPFRHCSLPLLSTPCPFQFSSQPHIAQSKCNSAPVSCS
jgi:hypothetical protein